jgi:hypothetical protein
LLQLENIRDAWQNLHAKLSTPSVFLSYEWFHVCLTNIAREQGVSLSVTVQDRKIDRGCAARTHATNTKKALQFVASTYSCSPSLIGSWLAVISWFPKQFVSTQLRTVKVFD